MKTIGGRQYWRKGEAGKLQRHRRKSKGGTDQIDRYKLTGKRETERPSNAE